MQRGKNWSWKEVLLKKIYQNYNYAKEVDMFQTCYENVLTLRAENYLRRRSWRKSEWLADRLASVGTTPTEKAADRLK